MNLEIKRLMNLQCKIDEVLIDYINRSDVIGDNTSIRDYVDGKDSLRDYKNSELIRFIEDNETTHHAVLACVCAEILRRMDEKSPILEVNAMKRN